MLSTAEKSKRLKFYIKIFGCKRMSGSIFSDHLWPVQNYNEKIEGLLERGFKNPQKMITSLPAILSYSFDNIDKKIEGLLEREFKDPQKMIISSPAILNYSLDNIDKKIEGLLERGFKDPQKMITSSPAILGLSFNNIDRKLRLCRRLKVDVDAFIAHSVFFTIMSSKNYIPILRACRAQGKEPSPKNIFAIYKAKRF